MSKAKASGEGKKFDENKLRYDLVDAHAHAEMVAVLTYGAELYGDGNWRGVSTKRYMDALMRHVEAWRVGEIVDPDTGLHHLAHAACCVHFLLGLAIDEAEVDTVFAKPVRLRYALERAREIKRRRDGADDA